MMVRREMGLEVSGQSIQVLRSLNFGREGGQSRSRQADARTLADFPPPTDRALVYPPAVGTL